MQGNDSRIKRILYRARHRGTKEMDIILGDFALTELTKLDDKSLLAFEDMMDMPDPQIDLWVKGAEPPSGLATIIHCIRRHHGLES